MNLFKSLTAHGTAEPVSKQTVFQEKMRRMTLAAILGLCLGLVWWGAVTLNNFFVVILCVFGGAITLIWRVGDHDFSKVTNHQLANLAQRVAPHDDLRERLAAILDGQSDVLYRFQFLSLRALAARRDHEMTLHAIKRPRSSSNGEGRNGQ